MRKIIFILIIVLIFFVGTTYSREDVKDGEYLIKVSNITNKNINLLDTCTYKIITIYPDNTYNVMKSYIYNNDIDSFEKMYLKKIEKISTSEYYNDTTIANFRKYDNIEDSIEDHGRFLYENSRYAESGLFSGKNYKEQAQALENAGVHTETGIFGAMMKVSLINDGPTTIILDSKEII